MPTTPLSGLPYPLLTDSNNPPFYIQSLATALDPLTSPQIVSYTPVWSQVGGTTLAIGNGSLTGKYARSGRIVQWRITLIRGTTSNFGTDVYLWTLPVPSEAGTCVGTGYAVVGGVARGFILRQPNTSQVIGVRPDDSDLSRASFAWAAGDFIAMGGSYLAAS